MALRRDEGFDDSRWLQQAACRGEHSASFFPPPQFERKDVRLARERSAKSICRQCSVVSQCLDYAIRTREPHGVWGGLNEIEPGQLLGGDAGAGGSAPSSVTRR